MTRKERKSFFRFLIKSSPVKGYLKRRKEYNLQKKKTIEAVKASNKNSFDKHLIISRIERGAGNFEKRTSINELKNIEHSAKIATTPVEVK